MSKEKLAEMQKQFKDHVLTVELDTDSTKIYLFKNPKNQNLWQRWILNNCRLIVMGDAYDSIYYSGAFDSLERIAGCNLGYFNSKCVADRDGWEQSKFDGDVAHKSVTQMAINYYQNKDLFKESQTDKEKIEAINEYLDKEYYFEIPSSFDGQMDFDELMNEHGHSIGGPDWWEAVQSTKLNYHPYWHLAAIKEAVKQLQPVESN